jgi:ABC-type nickel/cobalt efflux system permease component RcnA
MEVRILLIHVIFILAISIVAWFGSGFYISKEIQRYLRWIGLGTILAVFIWIYIWCFGLFKKEKKEDHGEGQRIIKGEKIVINLCHDHRDHHKHHHEHHE